MKLISSCLFIILIGAASALGQQRHMGDERPTTGSRFILTPSNADSGAQEPTAASASSVQSMSLLDEKRALKVGDLVSFRIIEDGDSAVFLKLTDGGELDIPLAGRIAAAGKTCKQLAYEIKDSLEKRYYKHATVILGLESVNAGSIGHIYITGQVLGQGQLELMANEVLTVSKAIVRAGGFADFADQRRVRVIRAAPDGKTKTMIVDVKAILTKGLMEKDIPLESGDMVVIPERAINF